MKRSALKFFAFAGCVALSACSDTGFRGEIWSETVATSLAGAVSSLRGVNGQLADYKPIPPVRQRLLEFGDFLDPVRVAHADTTACSTLQSNILGPNPPVPPDGPAYTACVRQNPTDPSGAAQYLEIAYINCSTPDFGFGAPYARIFVRYNLGSAPNCTAALADPLGFVHYVANNLAVPGTPFVVNRTFGRSASGDQTQVRISPNNEIVYGYSDFPSGFKRTFQGVSTDPQPMGGTQLSIDNSGNVTVAILGLHYLAFDSHDVPAFFGDKTGLDLDAIPDDSGRYAAWDHTINEVALNQGLFEIGEAIVADTDGSPKFDNSKDINGATSALASNIAYNATTNTIAKGPIIRTQHNHTNSVGITIVTDPLVWGDPNCPFPTAGTLYTQYDRQLVAPGLDETITFHTTCGTIHYQHPNGAIAETNLNHVF